MDKEGRSLWLIPWTSHRFLITHRPVQDSLKTFLLPPPPGMQKQREQWFLLLKLFFSPRQKWDLFSKSRIFSIAVIRQQTAHPLHSASLFPLQVFCYTFIYCIYFSFQPFCNLHCNMELILLVQYCRLWSPWVRVALNAVWTLVRGIAVAILSPSDRNHPPSNHSSIAAMVMLLTSPLPHFLRPDLASGCFWKSCAPLTSFQI